MAHCKHKTRITLSRVAGEIDHRHPRFDISVEWLFEVATDNADHAVRLAIQYQLLTFQIRIAIQTFMPRLFIDDDLPWSARLVFTGNKRATQYRLEVEKLEVVSRNKSTTDAIGSIGAGDVDTLRLQPDEILD